VKCDASVSPQSSASRPGNDDAKVHAKAYDGEVGYGAFETTFPVEILGDTVRRSECDGGHDAGATSGVALADLAHDDERVHPRMRAVNLFGLHHGGGGTHVGCDCEERNRGKICRGLRKSDGARETCVHGQIGYAKGQHGWRGSSRAAT
jgi:hypothetical protein